MPWPTCPAAVPAVLSLIGSLVLRVSGRLSRLLYGSFLHGSRPRAGAEARWRPVFGPEKEIHGKSGHADRAHAAGDVPGSSATGSPYFRWHERYWKLLAPPLIVGMFNSTPFKSPVWRLLGVRTGRRVFNDGCAIPERALVTIGDRCTLNAGLVICHSRPGQQARHRSARTCLAASSVTFPCWPEPAWPPRMQRMRRTDSTSWKPCGTLTRRSGTSAITSSSPAAGRSRPRRDRQTALSDAGRGRR